MARRRLTDAEYLAMYQAVAPYVAWRTTRTAGFPPSLKRRIAQAFNELRDVRARGLTPVPVRRGKRESKREYEQRLARARRKAGAARSTLAAVPARVSSRETARVVGDQVVVTAPPAPAAPSGRRQWWSAFDPRGLATDPAREAGRIWDASVALAASLGLTRRHGMAITVGPRRSQGSNPYIYDRDAWIDEVEAAVQYYSARALTGAYTSAS